jgi:hypothetical protein
MTIDVEGNDCTVRSPHSDNLPQGIARGARPSNVLRTKRLIQSGAKNLGFSSLFAPRCALQELVLLSCSSSCSCSDPPGRKEEIDRGPNHERES